MRNTLVAIKNKRTNSNLCEHGTDTNVMICVPCRSKHYADNHLSEVEYVPTNSDFKNQPFIFGGISFRKSAFDKHACSTNKFHAFAIIRKVNVDKIESGERSGAQNALLALNGNQRSKLKYLFINACALMLKGRPYSEYEFYVKMDKVRGIDVGTTYLNRKAAMEFRSAISKCEIDKLRALFRECKFYSLILDESTDVYRLEQCIVYIRFSIRGKIYTKFCILIVLFIPMQSKSLIALSLF